MKRPLSFSHDYIMRISVGLVRTVQAVQKHESKHWNLGLSTVMILNCLAA